MTYQQLYVELSRYSTFADGNLHALAGVTFTPCEKTHDLEAELQSGLDMLTISDLYLVNVNLVDVTRPTKFGQSLGLKKSTLEKIGSRYQDVDQRVTEVLAAWLEGRDDTSEPNWREVIAALKSADMADIVHQLIAKLSESNDSQDPGETFHTVDDANLDGTDSLNVIAEYVQDFKRKWFHLGLSLGLHYSTLKDLEASHHHDVGDHMNGVLMNWLEGKGVGAPPPSWRSLAQALASPLVKEGQVARRIQKEHHIETQHT